nr:arginine decarboxylase [Ipomoea batatas]
MGPNRVEMAKDGVKYKQERLATGVAKPVARNRGHSHPVAMSVATGVARPVATIVAICRKDFCAHCLSSRMIFTLKSFELAFLVVALQVIRSCRESFLGRDSWIIIGEASGGLGVDYDSSKSSDSDDLSIGYSLNEYASAGVHCSGCFFFQSSAMVAKVSPQPTAEAVLRQGSRGLTSATPFR